VAPPRIHTIDSRLPEAGGIGVGDSEIASSPPGRASKEHSGPATSRSLDRRPSWAEVVIEFLSPSSAAPPRWTTSSLVGMSTNSPIDWTSPVIDLVTTEIN